MSKHQTTVKPGTKIRLADFNPASRGGFKDKEDAARETADNVEALGHLAYRLYAENKRSLLIVLQGMDTAGKDGTIRHVMDAVNPQGCQVVSFKQPGAEELDHDFLWRIHLRVPAIGNLGIFNRSHYEDVLIVRVHNLVPKEEWKTRYERINTFEKLLVEGGTTVMKFYLHISKDEQKERLQARLDDPEKRWKFSPGDVAERKFWDDYTQAYEDALTRCNTEHAPWHIIPANHKWYRNYLVSRILREKLEEMNPQFPPAHPDLDKIVVE